MPMAPRFPTDHLPAIDVRPAVGRFDDFATVVGPRGPGVRSCWCMAYRDSRVGTAERPEYMRAACATEPGPGVLLYVDDVVAGWCSVAPRATYRRLLHSRTIPAPLEENTWAVVCFVVRAGYRKHGLMHHLLTGAVEHARLAGAQAIEGYPVDAAGGPVDVISGYVGTVTLFERGGFQRAEPTAGHSGGRSRWVMRRTLG